MKQRTKVLAAGLLAAASMAGTSHAIVLNEGTDAGQTLPLAKSTGTDATTALTQINGTFGSAADADLYAITLTAPGTFVATTVNTASNAQDTALFLFTAAGVPIATNDDANGTTLESTLPAGNAFYATLAAGTYFLGISESGNEPVNTASQLLFAGYPGGDTATVRGAASGLNPTTESTFNGNESDTMTFGAYEIDLTSVNTAVNPLAVPEPSTWAALAVGGIVAAFAFLRRRTGSLA